MRRWFESAVVLPTRAERRDVRSEIVLLEGTGMQRVLGRLRPGNEVSRMLIVSGEVAIFECARRLAVLVSRFAPQEQSML